jgi:hypothetical protein
MSALNFPNTPTNGQVHSVGSRSWIYNSSLGAWEGGSPAITKELLGVTGTNTGDQTITLTGDVTGTGTGTFAATIANSAVSLTKMANVATGTVFYRKTAGSGAPEVQTLSTLKTDLGLSGTNSGDQNLSGLVPYTGATGAVNLGSQSLTAGTITSNGNTVATVVDPVRTTLTGNGALSAFAISGAGSLINPSALIVAIDGALQEPTVDYGVSGGVITFTSPLASGAKAVVISPTNSLQVTEMIPADGSVTSAKLANDLEISGDLEVVGESTVSGQPTLSAMSSTHVMTKDRVEEISPFSRHLASTAAIAFMPLGFSRFDANVTWASGWGTDNPPAVGLPFLHGKAFQKVTINHISGTHPTATLQIGIYNSDSNGNPTTLVESGTISLSATGRKTLTLSIPRTIKGLFYIFMRSSLGNTNFIAGGSGTSLTILGCSVAHSPILNQICGAVNPTTFTTFHGTNIPVYSSYSSLPATMVGNITYLQTANAPLPICVIHN